VHPKCVLQLGDRPCGGRDRREPRGSQPARARGEPAGRPGALLRGLLQLAAAARARERRADVSCSSDRRRADGRRSGALLPRPRAREGAGDDSTHAVAPGSAVLQRRRRPDLLGLVAGRPRLTGSDARVRGRIATGARG
jgi:hypothetical protein